MLQGEHSALLSTFIKLPFVFKTFVLSMFEWPLKTGFTVLPFGIVYIPYGLINAPLKFVYVPFNLGVFQCSEPLLLLGGLFIFFSIQPMPLNSQISLCFL